MLWLKRFTIRPKFIKIFFLSLVLFLPHLYLNAQTETTFEYFPHPFKTRFIGKTIESEPGAPCEITSYRYVSALSVEEVADFYRNLLSQEGFTQLDEPDIAPNNSRTGILMFHKGFTERVNVNVGLRKLSTKELRYKVNVYQERDLLYTSDYDFVKPQRHETLPVPFGASEAVPKKKVDFTGGGKYLKDRVMYLVRGDVDEVISFYLKEMPEYDWKLTHNEAFEGKRNIIEAFGGQGHLKKFLEYGVDPYSIYPGIEIDTKGISLAYELKDKICYIDIAQLNDSAETLRQMRINPKPFEKYGRIQVFIVITDKQTEERVQQEVKGLLDQYTPFLRKYLGQ